MEKHSTCLITSVGPLYTTIHKSDKWFKLLSKIWGTEFSSYFGARRQEEVELPKLTVCKVINTASGEERPDYYNLISDGKDYAIIGRDGIIVEGEDNNIKFFRLIFK